MRLFPASSLVICCLLVSGAAVAQLSPPRDSQALVVLSRSLGAMNATDAATRIRSAVVQGTIQAAPGTNEKTATFVWQDSFELQSHEFRRELRTAGESRVFVSGHGHPAYSAKGHTKRLSAHVGYAMWPLHLPPVMLSQVLANSAYSITLKESATVAGRPAIHLHVSTETDPVSKSLGTQDWYFDAASGLPLRVQYRIPDSLDALKFETATVEYADYRFVAGILLPFRIEGTRMGQPERALLISGAELNVPLSSFDFELPEGSQQ